MSAFDNKTETAFIVSAIISAVSALGVLITFVVFPIMRTRYFMDMIIWISVCDLIAAAVSAFGFPPNASLLCPFQSALNVCFFKASWMWTTMLAHQLFSVATRRSLGFSPKSRHLICWSVPLVSTLLPLTTNSFGRSDDGVAVGWCFLTGNPTGYEVWFAVAFVLPMFACVAIMIYYAIRTYFLYRSLGENRRELQATIDAIILYPIGMIICWLPNLIFVIFQNSGVIPESDTASFVGNIFSILASQNGTMTAFIFFLKSKESQFRWMVLLRCSNDTRVTSIDHSTSVPIVVDADTFFSDPKWLNDAKRMERPSYIPELMNGGFDSESGASTSTGGTGLSGGMLGSSSLVRPTDVTNPIPISYAGSDSSRSASSSSRQPSNSRPVSSVTNSMRSEINFTSFMGSSPDSTAGWERYPSKDIQMAATPNARALSQSSVGTSASTINILNETNAKRKTKMSLKPEDVIEEEEEQ